MDVSQDRVYRVSYTFIEGFCPNLGGFVLGALVKGVLSGGFLGGLSGRFFLGVVRRVSVPHCSQRYKPNKCQHINICRNRNSVNCGALVILRCGHGRPSVGLVK